MDANNQCSIGAKSSYLCRQLTSRWIPTADQIRILRELYYSSGVRSPTAKQIQRISSRLRQYGMIEGKNVFFWFQNRRARERPKKKLTMDMPSSSNISYPNSHNNYNPCMHNTMLRTSNGVGGATSGVQDAGNAHDISSLFLERSVRESCLSMVDGSIVENNNNMHHCIKDEAPTSIAATREVETLPLFPTHSKDQEEEQEDKHHLNNGHCTRPNGGYLQPAAYYWTACQKQYNYHHHYTANTDAASLELTLNCYRASVGPM